MKTFTKIFIAAGIAALSFASCSEDKLDLDNPNALTSSTAFNTEADIDASLTGIYHGFYNSYYAMMSSCIVDGQSDIGTTFSNPDFQAYVKHVYSNLAHHFSNTTWNMLYEQIARCNQVITYAEQIEKWSTFNKEQILAQARAVRAFDYFQLATIYCVPPYVYYIAPSDDQPAQSDYNELMGHVIEDALYAYKTLPASYMSADGYNGVASWKDQHRVTKWFAACVLAKAYMNNGDWKSGGYDYQDALPIYKDIVENGGFTLVSDPNYNFNETNENNSESIFEIQMEPGSNGWHNYYGWDNNGQNVSQSQWRWKFFGANPVGWPDYNCENWVQHAFKNEKAKVGTNNSEYDSRIPATIFYSEIFNDFPEWNQWQCWTKTTGAINNNQDPSTDYPGFSFSGWSAAKTYINKYADPYKEYRAINADNSDGCNIRIFRLGEIMMDYAECLAQTGDIKGAVDVVDKVRERAGLCKLGERQDYKIDAVWTNPETGGTSDFNADYGYAAFENGKIGSLDDFMKVLDIEDVKESCWEAQRLFDIRRWGIAYNSEYLAKVKLRSYKYYQNWKPVHAWIPMPLGDVNNNPNLNQLEGW